MSDAPRETVHNGGLFRLEHQPVDGYPVPYEFVRRIGAVTMLPIFYGAGGPNVLAIHNARLYYGSSIGLPGGNMEGGFDEPELPATTAERELKEETGYGFRSVSSRNLDIFSLRGLSSTITYPRFFAVMRNVVYLGGEDDNPHEVVTPQPVPLDEYVDKLFRLERGELYPEVNAAFAKAGMQLGKDAVREWLLRGSDSRHGEEVTAAFEPWMTAA